MLVGIHLGCYPRLVYVVPLGQVDDGGWAWSERGGFGGRAARTPCALRAVMLTAVQSLRRAGSEGGWWGDKRRDAASTLGLVGRQAVGRRFRFAGVSWLVG
jgi:hypothetical protein